MTRYSSLDFLKKLIEEVYNCNKDSLMVDKERIPLKFGTLYKFTYLEENLILLIHGYKKGHDFDISNLDHEYNPRL